MAESRLLGEGLPKSLDARRLREFLKLSPQHRQTIAGELSRISPPGWRRPGNAAEFYELLLELVWSAQGRLAYVDAAKALKATEAVRKEKGDLALVLARDCVKRIGHKAPKLKSLKNDRVLSACEKRLAEKGQWNRLAELIWARSLGDGSGDHVQRAVEERYQLASELESVVEGLIMPEAVGSNDIVSSDDSAECLVSRVRELAERLDGLAFAPVAELHAATEQLLRIVRANEDRRGSSGESSIEPAPEPEPEAERDLPEEWRDAMGICKESFVPMLGSIWRYGLPLPEIGYDLPTKRGEVIAEVEIAWPDTKVAIIGEDDTQNRQPLESAGWHVLDSTVDVTLIAGALNSLSVKS